MYFREDVNLDQQMARCINLKQQLQSQMTLTPRNSAEIRVSQDAKVIGFTLLKHASCRPGRTRAQPGFLIRVEHSVPVQHSERTE